MPQSDLLRHLYAGIRAVPPFGVFLSRLVRQLGADHGYLVIEDGGHSRLCCHAAQEAEAISYPDGIALPLAQMPAGIGLTGCDIGGIEHLLQSAGHAPQILAIDSGPVRCGPPKRRMRLRLMRRGDQPFAADAKALLHQLNRHLDEACGLFLDLADRHRERDLLCSSLDRIALGHLVLDQDLRLVSATPKGAEIAARQGLLCPDGIGLRARGADTPLAKAVLGFFAQSAPSNRLSSCALSMIGVDATMLFATLRPCPPPQDHAPHARPHLILSLREAHDSQGPSAATLAHFFGLTPAEASLSAYIAHGFDLEETSRRLNISKNTAKSHLRMVFQKTGTSRQSQLLRIIWQAVDEFHPLPRPKTQHQIEDPLALMDDAAAAETAILL